MDAGTDAVEREAAALAALRWAASSARSARGDIRCGDIRGGEFPVRPVLGEYPGEPEAVAVRGGDRLGERTDSESEACVDCALWCP